MLNDVSLSKRLTILKGWCAGIRSGEFTLDEHRAQAMERMLGECAADAERFEIATGEASVPQQLRAAGKNVVALKAVLETASLRGKRA
jgi:hypothetical protein